MSNDRPDVGEMDGAVQLEISGDPAAKQPLENYATNLNEQAALGRIDPLIGRREEIQRTIQTFL